MKTATPTRLPPRFRTVPPAPADRDYLVLGMYCWSKGTTLAKATVNCRKSLGSWSPTHDWCLVYHVDPSAYVDAEGWIVNPPGNKPVELARFKAK